MKTITILLCALLVSCNPCKYVARHQECFLPDTIREINIQTVHDSVTWIMGDTSLFNAWFACDSMNNVIMKDLTEYKSKGVKSKIVFTDNHLQLSFLTDSIAVLNKIIKSTKTHTEYIKNPVNAELQKECLKTVKRLQNQRWLWWWFIASVIALATFIYFKIIK